MTKLLPVLRAAVTQGGWVTLVVDPQNWIFHFWVGHLEDGGDIFEMFRAHIDETCGFIDDTRNEKHEEDAEERKTHSDNAVKWLKRILSGPQSKYALQYGCGMTDINRNGQIICFVPEFHPDDPRSVSVLAHEIIHASIAFRERLNIRQDDNGEFLANVHTTIFQRLLEIFDRNDIYDILWPTTAAKIKNPPKRKR